VAFVHIKRGKAAFVAAETTRQRYRSSGRDGVITSDST